MYTIHICSGMEERYKAKYWKEGGKGERGEREMERRKEVERRERDEEERREKTSEAG